MVKDYYQILKVDRGSDETEIKKAYRDLALQLHPDKNDAANAHDQFVELNEAFQILADEAKRKQYDRLYDLYSTAGGSAISHSAIDDFEPIRAAARKESEKISESNFYLFTTELLAEMIGLTLWHGLGSLLKGTGEVIGDTLSGIDL